MIVHSLDSMPPLQQSVQLVADSGSFAVPPPRPVQTASLAPVAIGSAATAVPQLHVSSSAGASSGRGGAAQPMLFMSLAALALLLCARGYTAGGSHGSRIRT